MRLHPARRLSLFSYYLKHFFCDIPGLPDPEHFLACSIFSTLIPRVQSTFNVLRRINPTPFSTPPGVVFGPLTLADSPPSTLVDRLPPLCLEAFPGLTSNLTDPIASDPPLSPVPVLAPVPSTLPSFSPCPTPLADRVFPCRLVSGRRRRPLSSTWTAPRFKPLRGTFLLHRGLWNHAPWLDPLPTSFLPSSRAGQAFLWLCPPRPREPP